MSSSQQWVRLGEVVLDSGHLLVTTPAKAAERGEELWDAVMRLAEDEQGGELPGLASVLVAVPYEGRYVVERRGSDADVEIRIRLVDS